MKTFNATYTVSTTDLEGELAEELGKQIANEIDREILWGMLTGIGWTRVMISVSFNSEISEWIEDNITGAHHSNGRDFIFESEKDAAWFILRWT